jgi:hypothetical protein
MNAESRPTPLPISCDISRRGFLEKTAAAGAGLALAGAGRTAEGLPTRVLGRTKERVTILGRGTGPVGEGPVGPSAGETARAPLRPGGLTGAAVTPAAAKRSRDDIGA